MQLEFSGATSDRQVRYLVRPTADPLAQDAPNVVFNLTRSPKRISSIYVYDKRGTELFERQCSTPEYYLRRGESKLLNPYAGDVLGLFGFFTIFEVGARRAGKTPILFVEYERRGER